MEFKKFFGFGSKEREKEPEKSALKIEGLEFPPDFRGNLKSSIKAAEMDSMYFWANASEELKAIVPKVKEGYYLDSILRALDELAEEMNWTEYKQVDINVLNSRLEELLAKNRIERVEEDNPLLKHVDTDRD